LEILQGGDSVSSNAGPAAHAGGVPVLGDLLEATSVGDLASGLEAWMALNLQIQQNQSSTDE
jgi:hypothetical protein